MTDMDLLFPEPLYRSSGPVLPPLRCSLFAPSLCVVASLSGTGPEPSLPSPSALKHNH